MDDVVATSWPRQTEVPGPRHERARDKRARDRVPKDREPVGALSRAARDKAQPGALFASRSPMPFNRPRV